MRWTAWILVLAVGCGNDLRTQTRAFVATTPCGQGPYEVTLPVAATTGREGVEVIACTAHRLVGHVEVLNGQQHWTTEAFGDVADNQRCIAGNTAIVATRGDGSGAGASGPATDAAGAAAGAPALAEQPYRGSESPFGDEVCKPYGLQAQTLIVPSTMRTDEMRKGSLLRVRIWSDVPNDLEGAVFLVRHVTSKQSLAEAQKEDDKWIREHPAHDAPVETPKADHGAPPAPLAEERPPAPTTSATWIAGYWTWTGGAWGWIAGFWRDDGRLAMPAQRVEVPGAPPMPTAVWIGGRWTMHAGAWVWVGGRWRGR